MRSVEKSFVAEPCFFYYGLPGMLETFPRSVKDEQSLHQCLYWGRFKTSCPLSIPLVLFSTVTTDGYNIKGAKLDRYVRGRSVSIRVVQTEWTIYDLRVHWSSTRACLIHRRVIGYFFLNFVRGASVES